MLFPPPFWKLIWPKTRNHKNIASFRASLGWWISLQSIKHFFSFGQFAFKNSQSEKGKQGQKLLLFLIKKYHSGFLQKHIEISKGNGILCKLKRWFSKTTYMCIHLCVYACGRVGESKRERWRENEYNIANVVKCRYLGKVDKGIRNSLHYSCNFSINQRLCQH